MYFCRILCIKTMLNKETKYALRGLVYIQTQHLQGKMPGIDEIAQEIDAPRFFIAKILQRLVRLSFVSSQKGRGGGFYFSENQMNTSIKDVIMAIEGDKFINKCLFGLGHCDCENPCPLHEKYLPIRISIDQLVSESSVKSLAQKLVKEEIRLK